MKVQNQVTDTIKIGATRSKQATISGDKIGKLQYILTKGLYSDPVTAVIAEITNNGIDSVVQAGKDPKQYPVIVEIDKNDQGNYFFRVTDKGLGLIPYEFKNILMNYLESTKENDDSSIGYFGLGSKSFLGLERAATFTCRRNGAEWKFLAYQGAEFCEYDMISKKPTNEENGVTFEIPITDYSEYRDFVVKAKQKLAYYDTAALLIDKQLIQNEILRSQDWQYSNENTDIRVHLCLKDVYYTIDYDKLGIKPIHLPIGLRFGLKDGIAVTPSRESIIYTEKVKQIIKDKIAAVAEWFVKRYNDNNPDEKDSIIEAWDILDSVKRNVDVENIDFQINSIAAFSKLPIKELKIKGVSYRPPVFYKTTHSLLSNYSTVVHKKMSGSFKSDRKSIRAVDIVNKILQKDTVVLVNSNPLGYARKYLQQKYDRTDTTFVVQSSKRTLKYNSRTLGTESYASILLLTAFPKTEWRGRIVEFNRVEKEFLDKIIDERDVENTQAFKDWVVKHKDDLKNGRGTYTSKNYNALNKQDGEMTISIGRSGVRYADDCVFEKKTFKIRELYKQPGLFVLFDDKEKAEKYWPILRRSGVFVCMIGNKEITKLPLFRIKKFIKFEEFMTRDCKPFMRIASAILFKKVLEDFKVIKAGREDIFKHCLSKYLDDFNELKIYVDKNVVNVNSEVGKAILDVATEKKLFDLQLWDTYLRLKNAVERLDFLTVLKTPSYWDTEAESKMNRVINQMLLFQKKYYDLEGYELVKKPDAAPQVIKVSNEEEEEEELELEDAF